MRKGRSPKQFARFSDKECDKPETIVIKDALDKLSGPMKDEDHVRGHQINMEVMDDAGAVSAWAGKEGRVRIFLWKLRCMRSSNCLYCLCFRFICAAVSSHSSVWTARR